jgi:hypothetical protein
LLAPVRCAVEVIAGVERTVVRVAASETKNGEATEHFLLSDVADLLTLYLDTYLPIIAGGPPIHTSSAKSCRRLPWTRIRTPSRWCAASAGGKRR